MSVKTEPPAQAGGSVASKRSFANGESKSNTPEYFSRPLAPAPRAIFAAVVVVAIGLLYSVSENVSNDYLQAFSCFMVLASGAIVFDYTGRRHASRHPDSIYKPDGLPTGSPRIKAIIVIVTLFWLIGYVTPRAEPGNWGSPMPYFLAVGFLFLVMPQLLARREIRLTRRRQFLLSGSMPSRK